tara:strand:- start:61 stop:615 length:555 start_codon:yes stop_codon:yes gene_type:complete
MAWKHNDRIIRVGKSWVSDDGWKHPYNWQSSWTDKNKIDFNVVWEDEPDTIYDDRFYKKKDVEKVLGDTLWVDDDDKAIIDINTGKQGVSEGLKTNWIAQTKATANEKLSSTDWYVTRKIEKSTEIPSAITTYRNAVRSAQDTICTKISNCSDLDDFKALFVTPVDKDKKPTGNPPIYDFPNEV